MRDSRVRRARTLVSYWDEGEFIIENYLTRKRTAVSPLVTHILQSLGEYSSKKRLLRLFAGIPRSRKLIDELIDQDVLVKEGSETAARESTLHKIWKWGLDARFFHFSTQQVQFQDPESERVSLERLASEEPPPSPYKHSGARGIQLSGEFAKFRGEFWKVLRSRRTKRRFAREPISFNELSTLLLWTWGKTQVLDDPVLGRYILKTSPSGGARHPIEVYPLVLRVKDVSPGIYHYSVSQHQLEFIKAGQFDEAAVRLCANQPWVRDAAVVFFMTAIVERSMWKYKHSHAYRVILMDAGHLGQTFHLVCTKLGLAPFTSAAIHGLDVASELGLDEFGEIALYAAAVGRSP